MPGDEMMADVRTAALNVPGVSAVDKSYARKTGFSTTSIFTSRWILT